MPESVAEAIKAAEAEQAKYLELQHAALNAEPADRPSPGDVLAQAKAAELAQARVEIARRREEEAREAKRREACAELGGRIDAFYDDTARRALPVLARQAAEAIAALRAGISAHNAKVDGYDQEAAALETKPGNRGPRAEDSHVGRAGNGIRHGNKLVLKIGGNEASYAVNHVVAGDLDAALRELVTAKDLTPQPPREVCAGHVRGSSAAAGAGAAQHAEPGRRRQARQDDRGRARRMVGTAALMGKRRMQQVINPRAVVLGITGGGHDGRQQRRARLRQRQQPERHQPGESGPGGIRGAEGRQEQRDVSRAKNYTVKAGSSTKDQATKGQS